MARQNTALQRSRGKRGRARQKLKTIRLKKYVNPGGKKKKGRHYLSQKKFINAIQESGCLKTEIARQCGCTLKMVEKGLLKWPEAAEAFRMELEKMGDAAKQTVAEMMTQRRDFGVAANTSKWWLERKLKHEGFGASLAVEGGDKPISINQNITPLDILPLEQRVQVLQWLEEAQMKNVTPAAEALPAPADNNTNGDVEDGVEEDE